MGESGSGGAIQVSYIETDIDCHSCFDEVRHGLAAIPEVEGVEADMAAGCFVVTHRTDAEHLLPVVTELGHRIAVGDNGELVMSRATAVTAPGCTRHHANPDH
ncbi:MAG: hypothetical protein R2823_04965 [Acidimicrobiia bacterium]